MAKESKLTKVDILKTIAEMIDEGDLDAVFGTTESGMNVTGADVVNYAKLTISQLQDKAEKAKVKASAKKNEGDELRQIVLEAITDEWQTLDEIVDEVNENPAVDEEVSRAKVTSRLTALVNAELIQKQKTKIDHRNIMVYALPGAILEDEDDSEE